MCCPEKVIRQDAIASAATGVLHLDRVPPATDHESRFIDTVLGCLMGLIGGIGLHNARLRDTLGRQLRKLTPSRLLP